ncbi:MAG: ArsR/SmtB family transcription factor [Candidatus Methanofastidiosia archaeon]
MEIVEELGIEKSLVSHHLRKMKDAGILRSKLNGKQRL